MSTLGTTRPGTRARSRSRRPSCTASPGSGNLGIRRPNPHRPDTPGRYPMVPGTGPAAGTLGTGPIHPGTDRPVAGTGRMLLDSPGTGPAAADIDPIRPGTGPAVGTLGTGPIHPDTDPAVGTLDTDRMHPGTDRLVAGTGPTHPGIPGTGSMHPDTLDTDPAAAGTGPTRPGIPGTPGTSSTDRGDTSRSMCSARTVIGCDTAYPPRAGLCRSTRSRDCSAGCSKSHPCPSGVCTGCRSSTRCTDTRCCSTIRSSDPTT
jgi:hypothetical protein